MFSCETGLKSDKNKVMLIKKSPPPCFLSQFRFLFQALFPSLFRFLFRLQVPGLFSLLFLSLFLISDFGLAEKAPIPNPLLARVQLSSYQIQPYQVVEMVFQISLPKGYSAYLEKFKIEIIKPEGFKLGQFIASPISDFYDPSTKKTKKGLLDQSQLKISFEAPENLPEDEHELKISLTYQACTETFCLFPKTLNLSVPCEFLKKEQNPNPQKTFPENNKSSAAEAQSSVDAESTNKAKSISEAPDSTEPSSDSFFSFLNIESLSFDVIYKKGLLFSLLFLFLAGILTSFTPCIFPMIPITLAILGKSSVNKEKKRFQTFLLSLFYVLGICITYSSLGLMAGLTGTLFGSFMSNPFILTAICCIFLLMSLSLFGLFEIQTPLWLQNRLYKLTEVHSKSKETSKLSDPSSVPAPASLTSEYSKAFFSGLLAGVIAGPCVGPVLVGILTFVAKTQNAGLGFLFLFTFAFGMGQLFLLIGLSTQSLRFLPKSGSWMKFVNAVLGLILLALFYYFLNLLIKPLLGGNSFIWFSILSLLLLSFIFSSFFLSLKKNATKELSSQKKEETPKHLFYLSRAFLILAGVLLIFTFLNPQGGTKKERGFNVDANLWLKYSEEALLEAKMKNKPVLIDFYADWCVACKELDELTFTDQKFQLIATKFTLIKFDATVESPELALLRKKYKLVGLPSLIFINKEGVWVERLTVNSFEEAPALIKRMKELLQ